MPKNIYNYHYTYIIINTTNQMKYIGVRSCNCLPENDDEYMGSSKILGEAMQETPEVFTKTIIDTFSTREIANTNEQWLHETYDVARNSMFYNLCIAPVGFNMSGRIQTVESRAKMSESKSGEKHPMYGKHRSDATKKKISESHKGKTFSKESRKKMSESRTGSKNAMYGKSVSAATRKKLSEANSGEKHPMYGKHLPEETRKKMSESKSGEKSHMYGKHLPEETRKKISLANKGKTRTEETKKKMSDSHMGEKNHFYGKKHSIKTRKKMKESHIGKKPSEETRAKMSSAQKGILKAKITCPHCSKLGGISPMKRWHFANCKEIS